MSVNHKWLQNNLDTSLSQRLRELGITGAPQKVKAGERLCAATCCESCFFIIENGVVEVSTLLDEGREVPVELCGEGAIVGDVILEGPQERTTTARALTETIVSRIDAIAFKQHLSTDKALMSQVMAKLDNDMQRTQMSNAMIKFRSGTQQIGCYILDIWERRNKDRPLRLPFNKLALAKHLGLTPQSLSRSFRRLREQGLHVRGAEYRVTDTKRLRAYCGVR